jgi:hypothetical protein
MQDKDRKDRLTKLGQGGRGHDHYEGEKIIS